jgi:hypothetical protein
MMLPLIAAASSLATASCGGAAELLVFSGTPNPVVSLNATVADAVCDALGADEAAAPTCRALGFTGVKLATGRVVRGHATADALLLDAFEAAGTVPAVVLAHARAESARLRASGGDARCAAASASADAHHAAAAAAAATGCLDVPILQPQPDIPPVFDLKNDVRGCWVTECSKNNWCVRCALRPAPPSPPRAFATNMLP